MKKTLEEQLAFAYIYIHYFLVHNFNGFGLPRSGEFFTDPDPLILKGEYEILILQS
jgi:hypothetical protein